MSIVEINGLTFRYKNNFVFDNFNLKIDRGSWVTIAGPNGSGKTTLVKLLAGLEKSYSCIKILDYVLDKKNLFDIRKDTGFAFDTPDNFFACETVEDELAFSLENMAVMPKTIKKKINEISKLLKMEDILKQNPYELSGGQKQKVSLACALMLEPRILVLDEALLMIDINEREEIFKILKENGLEFNKLFDCKIYVYMSKSNPLSLKKCIDMKDLQDYPCLSFEQGDKNSFYFAEEVLSTYEYKQLIRANDRATMLNLMKGLNGYTLCSGIICEELNGGDYCAVPLESDEVMTIGYLCRKGVAISPLGQKYLDEIRKYKNEDARYR